MAGAALTTKVKALPKDQYPAAFKNPAFKGEVFALDELVIDVPALVRALVKANQEAVFKIEPLCGDELKFDNHGHLLSATVYHSGKSIEVTAQQFVFAAGAGNEVIINKLKQPVVAMQRRPLHMVLVKTGFDLPVYAHCMGMGPRPRITITTHHLQNGEAVWYLGGQLAEDGVTRTAANKLKRRRINVLFLG